MSKVTEEAYLCRVNPMSFVVGIDGRTISTTTIPSAARHMGYAEADRMVQWLRRRAYKHAVVTDYLGVPVSALDLRLSTLSEREDNPLPKSLDALNKIPAGEYKKRCATEPAFRQRAEELESR